MGCAARPKGRSPPHGARGPPIAVGCVVTFEREAKDLAPDDASKTGAPRARGEGRERQQTDADRLQREGCARRGGEGDLDADRARLGPTNMGPAIRSGCNVARALYWWWLNSWTSAPVSRTRIRVAMCQQRSLSSIVPAHPVIGVRTYLQILTRFGPELIRYGQSYVRKSDDLLPCSPQLSWSWRSAHAGQAPTWQYEATNS